MEMAANVMWEAAKLYEIRTPENLSIAAIPSIWLQEREGGGGKLVFIPIVSSSKHVCNPQQGGALEENNPTLSSSLRCLALTWLDLSCAVLCCVVLCCLVLYCLALSLSCLVWSCLAFPRICLILSCDVLVPVWSYQQKEGCVIKRNVSWRSNKVFG